MSTIASVAASAGVGVGTVSREALAGGEPRCQELGLELQVRSTTARPAGGSTNAVESRPMRPRLLNGMMREPKQFEGER